MITSSGPAPYLSGKLPLDEGGAVVDACGGNETGEMPVDGQADHLVADPAASCVDTLPTSQKAKRPAISCKPFLLVLMGGIEPSTY
jgi:hypothetical protein